MFYPVFLNLQGRPVTVIGGGEVAERKVESLAEAGASVTVISPRLTSRLESLAAEKRIRVERRPYAAGDSAGAVLVFSATDDPEVSAAVFQDAAKAGVLVNTADDPARCDFIMPSVARNGEIAIAISTGGASPGLAALLRRKIEELIGPEYAALAELLSGSREEIKRRFPDPHRRRDVHYRILNSDIIDRLKRQDSAGAERRLREIIES
jgi:siroheme synthase-like protein